MSAPVAGVRPAGITLFGAHWSTASLFAAAVAALLIYYFAPSLPGVIAGALVFLAIAAVRLEVGLAFVLITAPLYRFPRELDAEALGIAGLVGPMAPAFSLMEFSVLACTAAWLLRVAVDPAWRERANVLLRRTVVAPLSLVLNPVTLLLVAAGLSLLAAVNLTVSLRELRVVIIEPLLFAGLLAWLVRDRDGVLHWLDVFVALGLGMALFSLYHYFVIGVVERTGGVERVLAIYHSPNALALFLGRILPVALVLLAWRRPIAPWQAALYGAAAILLAATLVLTFSRGALVAMIGVLVVVLVLRGSWRWLWAALAAGVAAIGGLIASGAGERVVSDVTNLQRLNLWQSAIAMIRDHPILGVGLDNFLYRYRDEYILPAAWAEPDMSHPHNILLDFWTRIGILGVAAMLWLQVSFWRRGLRLLRGSDPLQAVAALALVASMTGFLIHGVIDNSFFLVDLAVVFWLTYVLMMRLAATSCES